MPRSISWQKWIKCPVKCEHGLWIVQNGNSLCRPALLDQFISSSVCVGTVEAHTSLQQSMPVDLFTMSGMKGYQWLHPKVNSCSHKKGPIFYICLGDKFKLVQNTLEPSGMSGVFNFLNKTSMIILCRGLHHIDSRLLDRLRSRVLSRPAVIHGWSRIASRVGRSPGL